MTTSHITVITVIVSGTTAGDKIRKRTGMLISINERDSRPLYQQIVNQIKEQVSRGTLAPGDELPSVRDLSDSLGINMHTVRRAYLELRDQGIINLHLGRKARIARARLAPAGEDTREYLRTRFTELITDATLAGFTPDEIRAVVEKNLQL